MIDFDLMVRNILWESGGGGAGGAGAGAGGAGAGGAGGAGAGGVGAGGAGAGGAGAGAGGAGAGAGGGDPEASNLAEFLTKTSAGISVVPYDELKQYWTTNFAKYAPGFFANDTDLTNTVFNAMSDLPRSGGGGGRTYEKFDNLESIFPVLDLISLLYGNNFKGNVAANKAKAPDSYNTFITRLKNQKTQKPNIRPLEYEPITAWAKNLRTAYFSSVTGVVGKLRMDDPSLDPNSFYQVIFNFLKIRKQAVSLKLPIALRNVSGESMVNAIMMQPWNVQNGHFAINDQILREVYDQMSVDKIVEVSLAAHALYKNQLSLILGEEGLKNYSQNKQLYAKFIGKDSPAAAMQWTVVESFDGLYAMLAGEILNEVAGAGGAGAGGAGAGAGGAGAGGAGAGGAGAGGAGAGGAPSGTLRPFETTADNFIYSFANLKLADSQFNVEEASLLLKAMESLANYIKTTSGNFMGGVTQMAQGLAGLGKKMGS